MTISNFKSAELDRRQSQLRGIGDWRRLHCPYQPTSLKDLGFLQTQIYHKGGSRRNCTKRQLLALRGNNLVLSGV